MQEQKKKLGVFDLVSIGVGSMIGAGIFSMLGIGIYYSGRGIPLALIIASLLVFVEYIRSFILAAVFDLDGGSYAHSSLTMPPFMIGAGALTTVIANLSLSVMGLTMASYLAQLVPALANYQSIVAFIIMTAFFAISLGGSKFLAKIQNVMVVLMYVALALFIVFGIIKSDPAATAATPFLPQGGTGLLIAVAMMSFTCNGVTNLVNMSADTENPKKKIPLAMILATAVGAVIYALLGFAATSALPYEQVAGQNLGFIAQQIMPNALYLFFIFGGAIFSLATTLLGGIAAMKWPIMASAKDGWLPAVFAKQTKKGYPWAVMLMMYLIAVVPIIGGFSLESIVSMILVPAAIMTVVGNIINWNLPKKFPKAWADNSLHLSITGYHILMILSTISAIILSFFTLTTQSTGMIIANLAMTVFLFAYSIIRYRSGKVHLHARDIYTE